MWLQAQGIVKPAMYITVVFVGVDFALNYLFIHTFGLGFKGSPLATGIAIWMQLIVLTVYLLITKEYEKTWHGWNNRT
jgi:MATE family multidrug resistance protein